MRIEHTISALLVGVGLSILTGCTPLYPGGLSEAEWSSLPPEKRAELRLRQDQVNAARQSNWEQELTRAEMRREHDEKMKQKTEPSIRLSPEDAAAINSLTR